MITRRLLGALAAVLIPAGCGFLNEAPNLEEFIFEEATHGVTIQPGIDVAGINQSIALVGQLNTPTPCQTLRADLKDSGSQLTLTVTARSTGGNCEMIVGNYRYQAIIRNLSDGTYQLTVVHTFDGSTWPAQTFTSSVTVD